MSLQTLNILITFLLFLAQLRRFVIFWEILSQAFRNFRLGKAVKFILNLLLICIFMKSFQLFSWWDISTFQLFVNLCLKLFKISSLIILRGLLHQNLLHLRQLDSFQIFFVFNKFLRPRKKRSFIFVSLIMKGGCRQITQCLINVVKFQEIPLSRRELL